MKYTQVWTLHMVINGVSIFLYEDIVIKWNNNNPTGVYVNTGKLVNNNFK